MRATVRALVGLLVLVASIATAGTQEGPATFADAKALASAQDKPLLVDFFATW